MENNLNRIVSNNIKNVKRDLIVEHRIVKQSITEIQNYNKKKGKNIKTMKEDIITEMFYLNSLGIKHNVINENIIDWFKGVLGIGDNTIIEPVIDTFKESYIGYVIKLVAPGSTNSILANIIKTGLADIDMNDMDKLTDCEFLSDTISKAIVEGTVNKLKNNVGLVGGVFDVVRNSIIDFVDNTEFANRIQDGVSNFICDAIADKIEILKDKVEQMKTNI
jgi:hypothetical protein